MLAYIPYMDPMGNDINGSSDIDVDVTSPVTHQLLSGLTNQLPT